MTGPRIGSLFTGTGALDMAVMDVLGGSIAWHCQYDPEDRHQYAARILEHHWPAVPNLGDITQVDWTQVEPVDVLTAGFPCQDLSYAGRGAGIKEGTRSGLWYSVADAIRALRPGLVFLENVRAIVGRRPGLDVVLASLADLGFDAEWCTLRASDVGAPHQRERWFCLAWPADSDGPRLEGAGARRATPQRSVVAPYAAHLGQERCRSARDGRPGSENRHLVAADAGHRLVPEQSRPEGWKGGKREPERGISGSDGQGLVDWAQFGPAIARWEHVLGRPAPSPVDDRGRLDPRFVEWMMGLPEGHVCDVPAPEGMTAAGLRNARLKALGNGVVRQQCAYALRVLLHRMRSEVAA